MTCQVVVHYCLLKSVKWESVCCTAHNETCFPPVVLQTANWILWIFFISFWASAFSTKIASFSKLLSSVMQKHGAASFLLDKKVVLLEILHAHDDEKVFLLQICEDKGSQLWPLCKWLLESKWVSSRPFLDYSLGSGGVWLFHVQLFLWLRLSQNVHIQTYLFWSFSNTVTLCNAFQLELSRKFCLG